MFACVFIKYWEGLHNEEEREALRSGAEVVQRNALSEAEDMDTAPIPLLGLPSTSRKRARSPEDDGRRNDVPVSEKQPLIPGGAPVRVVFCWEIAFGVSFVGCED